MKQRTTTIPATRRISPHLRPLAACLALALTAGLQAGQALGDASSSDNGAAPPNHPAAHSVSSAAAASGVVRVVKNCADSGTDSLREAYSLAGDGDTIDLSQLACSRITLTTGALTDPAGAASVTIAQTKNAPVVIDGGGNDRVIVHNGAGNLSINGLITITHGYFNKSGGSGGCIYSAGNVSLVDATVSSCRVKSVGSDVARGGAVFSSKGVSLLFSNVIGNQADSPGSHSAGGGIWAPKVNLTKSTVSGNTVSSEASYSLGGGVYASQTLYAGYATISANGASEGGGLFTDALTMVNSTVSSNYAFAVGGAYARTSAAVYGSTIAKNSGGFDRYAAGLFVAGGDIKLDSTIIATNSVYLVESDLGSSGGSTVAGANNLVIAHASGINLPADTKVDNPLLGPLQDNGGFTRTHALLPGSPAIDNGNNVLGRTFDQRSSVRVAGIRADIGAFEADRIFIGNFDVPDSIFTSTFDP